MTRTEPAKPTILVVDDEIGILNLLTSVLRRYGFEVLTASEGIKGVETYRQNRSAIDLVLLDAQMPNSDGVKTLTELQRIDPAVPVAFMSGSSGEFSSGELLGIVHVFRKPFLSLTYLAHTVKELIGLRNAKV